MSNLAKNLLEIEKLCLSVCQKFDGHNISPILRKQVESGEDIWDRRNWTGHLTASAIVINSDASTCLMMGHKKLGFELAPGGHCDPYEQPHISAQRELFEETGVFSAEMAHWHGVNQYCPIDIDTHAIPNNTTKGEPSHFHHDFRYLFILTRNHDTILNETEGTWLDWLPISTLKQRYPRVYSRMKVIN